KFEKSRTHVQRRSTAETANYCRNDDPLPKQWASALHRTSKNPAAKSQQPRSSAPLKLWENHSHACAFSAFRFDQQPAMMTFCDLLDNRKSEPASFLVPGGGFVGAEERLENMRKLVLRYANPFITYREFRALAAFNSRQQGNDYPTVHVRISQSIGDQV